MKKFLGCTAALLIALGFAVLLFYAVMLYQWRTSPEYPISRAYELCRMGMSKSQVMQLLGRKPDNTIPYCGGELLHFFPQGTHYEYTNEENGVPFYYASFQVFLGPDGNVLACDYVGETLHIKTAEREDRQFKNVAEYCAYLQNAH